MTPDPSDPTPDLDRLIAQAQAGDEAVWEELFRVCYPKVIRAVRRRLTGPLCSVFDSADFASEAFRRLLDESSPLEFRSFAALTAYLQEQAVMAEHRRFRKRDVA
jgi:DNA-directed RNA polymerase specialized sigma24 family protein